MSQEPQSPKINLFIFAIAGLMAILLVFVIIGNRDSDDSEPADNDTSTTQEATDEDTTSQTGDEDDAEDNDADEDNQPALPEAPQPGPPPVHAGVLPVNWSQLSPTEKTASNPFECPVNENGIIYLSAETGECLTGPSTEMEDEDDMIPTTLVRLGEAFQYDDDSEVTVTGLSCINLYSIDHLGPASQSLASILEDKADEYIRFKSDPDALFMEYSDQSLSFDDFEYFEYFSSLEKYLIEKGLMVPGDDLLEQLINYLNCEVFVTLKNIGAERSFSSGCGLSFVGPISLMSQEVLYGAESRNVVRFRSICTTALVPFPSGDSARTIVSFIVSSEDDITSILVRGPDVIFEVVLD